MPSAPPYPAALASREGPAPAGSGGLAGAVHVPRTRIQSFVLNYGGAIGRYTISTPLLKGPVILRNASWWWGGAVDPPALSLEFGWATAPVLEVGVGVSVQKNWNTFHSEARTGPTAQDAANTGIVHHSTRGISYWMDIDLQQLIPVDECYLIVSAIQTNGAALTAYGHFNLVEDVDREALRFFR